MSAFKDLGRIRVGGGTVLQGSKSYVPGVFDGADDGLAFLARQQKGDGSIGSTAYFERNVAVTALAGMAFLSAGHTPGRGKYGKQSQKCVDFVLSRCQPNGFI